jgi:hypothetical protein
MPGEHTPKPPCIFQGIADPTYLLREFEELRDIARAAGLGSLDYLLECAAIEARHLAKTKGRGGYVDQSGA